MRRLALTALIVLALAVPVFAAPAFAQVHVDIGIRLPGPPALAVVPGVPVYYAPHAPANVFFYDHQYWVFNNGGWYSGPTWNGPWAVVQPVFLPAPLLHVPVRYYHVPPPAWRGWVRTAPPHWDPHWGHDWHEAARERDWREREEHWAQRHGDHGDHHGDHHDNRRDDRHGHGR